MGKQVLVNAYNYHELDDEGKQIALDNLKYLYSEHMKELDLNWWDNAYYDFFEMAEVIGISVEKDKTYFSKKVMNENTAEGIQLTSFSGKYVYTEEDMKIAMNIIETDRLKNDTVSNIIKNIKAIQDRCDEPIDCDIISAGNDFIVQRINSKMSKQDEKLLEKQFVDLVIWFSNKLREDYKYYNDGQSLKDFISDECKHVYFDEHGRWLEYEEVV